MWFGLLGALSVRSGHAVLPVPAARQRVVLAALAVRAGRAVSFEELSEAIWDDCPPAGARVTVRNYVSRLRHLLGPAGGRIVTCAPGYLLDAADDDVDLLAFTRLCRDGGVAARAGAWQHASDVLDEALRLWRGTPLADVPSRVLRDEHVPVLEALRLQAVEWRLDAGLHLGKHSQLVSELQALVRERPLHERFRALLMLALYRSGQQADALNAYRGIRRALVDELGIEPGPELRELHHRILAADPGLMPGDEPAVPDTAGTAAAGRAERDPSGNPERPESAEPRQLPAGLRHFAGREAELDMLNGWLKGVGEPGGAAVVMAIGGTAGIGKTALAVHWAYQVADEFPDGQLYANMRGFGPSGTLVAAEAVVRDFLHALGVPPQRIPASLDAQTALYRTLLAGRRLLILLDNARDADHVRPLLPGGSGCLVLVTSRTELAALAAEGAHLLALDLPSEHEARELLAGRLGAQMVAAEPAAVDELIKLCARLPLALGVAAARAVARPSWSLTAVVAELRDTAGRLDVLDAGTATSSVRAAFRWSCQGLPTAAATLFRLLGFHPGPDISAPAAASLAGVPPAQAQATLGELTRAGLIAEHVPGRYSLHDLLRLYAAEEAAAIERDRDRLAAANRMLDHYLRSADTAAKALDPTHKTLTLGSVEAGVTAETIDSCDLALTWFEAEYKVLLAVTAQAAKDYPSTRVALLPGALLTFFDRSGRWHDLAASQQLALATSMRLGDLAAQARTHRDLGRARIMLGETDEAVRHVTAAVKLSQRLGDKGGEARAHLYLGVALHRARQYAVSLSSSVRALELAEAVCDPLLRAAACNNIGYCHAELGNFSQSLTYCQQALELHGQAGSPHLEGATWDSIGYAYHRLGDFRLAAESYRHSADLLRGIGSRYRSATALGHLGDACAAAGDAEAARDAWQEALAILDDLAHPDAAEVRVKLQVLLTASH